MANYVLWRIVQEHISNLSKPFRDVHDNYRNRIVGVSSSTPRWRTCLDNVDKVMKYAFGRMYVEENFDDEDTQVVSVLSIQGLFHTLVTSGRKWLQCLISTSWIVSSIKNRGGL